MVGAAGDDAASDVSKRAAIDSPGIAQFLTALYGFSRPHTMIGTAVSVSSISLLALGSAPLTSGPAIALIQALVSALLMNIAIVGINQLYDIEIDKVRPGVHRSPCRRQGCWGGVGPFQGVSVEGSVARSSCRSITSPFPRQGSSTGKENALEPVASTDSVRQLASPKSGARRRHILTTSPLPRFAPSSHACSSPHTTALPLPPAPSSQINKPYLPLASGALTPQQGTTIVIATAAAGTAIGLLAGSPPLLATLLISLFLGVIYSADLPFMRWKRSPLLAAGCILAVRAIIVQMGFYLHMRGAVLAAAAAGSETAVAVAAAAGAVAAGPAGGVARAAAAGSLGAWVLSSLQVRGLCRCK